MMLVTLSNGTSFTKSVLCDQCSTLNVHSTDLQVQASSDSLFDAFGTEAERSRQRILDYYKLLGLWRLWISLPTVILNRWLHLEFLKSIVYARTGKIDHWVWCNHAYGEKRYIGYSAYEYPARCGVKTIMKK